jgi:hypothetical protein
MTMTTLPEFGVGQIRLLWSTGSHDGMASAVALLNETVPVSLDAFDMGGSQLRPEWGQLKDLLEELLDSDDSENIWDRVQRKYDAKMHEEHDRMFHVHELPPEEFEQLLIDRRARTLHGGRSTVYFYEEDGVPKTEYDTWVDRDYMDAHYFDVVDWFTSRERLTAYPILGTVTREVLRSPSSIRSARPTDPRSEELKRYQATWKPGDPVRLDW